VTTLWTRNARKATQQNKTPTEHCSNQVRILVSERESRQTRVSKNM
jgi:hypothetical protein